MADWTQAVSSTINFFGVEPVNLWGVMVWGVDNWAYGNQRMPTDVESVGTMSTAIALDAFDIVPESIQSESLTLEGDGEDEELFDSNGYNYVFPAPAINLELSNQSIYVSGVATAITWVAGAQAGGVWV